MESLTSVFLKRELLYSGENDVILLSYFYELKDT